MWHLLHPLGVTMWPQLLLPLSQRTLVMPLVSLLLLPSLPPPYVAAAAGSVASPACSVNSSYSSNSEGSDMIGGGDSPCPEPFAG